MSDSSFDRTNITYIPEAEAVALQPHLDLSTNVAQFPVEAVPVESTILHTDANERNGMMTPHGYPSWQYPSQGASHAGYSAALSSLPLAPVVVNGSHFPASGQALPGQTLRYSPPVDIQNIPVAEVSVMDCGAFSGGYNATSTLSGGSMNNAYHVPLSLSDRSTHRKSAYVANPLPSSTLCQSNANRQALPTSNCSACYVRPGSNMKPYV